VILAGDLFHAVRPTNAAIVFAFRELQRLRAALPDAPIVLIAGNHDTPRSSETGSILRLYGELGVDVAAGEPRRLVYPGLDLSVLAVPHEVAPRIWYSGALAYVSSNPWGELADEARHGLLGKGWLLADLETGVVRRRPVPAARVVYDAPRIDAADLSAAAVDRLIAER